VWVSFSARASRMTIDHSGRGKRQAESERLPDEKATRRTRGDSAKGSGHGPMDRWRVGDFTGGMSEHAVYGPFSE
jgi:hypothetical protein